MYLLGSTMVRALALCPREPMVGIGDANESWLDVCLWFEFHVTLLVLVGFALGCKNIYRSQKQSK